MLETVEAVLSVGLDLNEFNGFKTFILLTAERKVSVFYLIVLYVHSGGITRCAVQ